MATPTVPTLASYNVNPAPTTGTTAYGEVPGQTALYPNTYSQVGALVPGLPNMTAGVAGNIQSEINGTLPASTVQELTQASAEQGVASGAPGSGLNSNNLIRSLGLNSEALTSQGTQDYLSFLTGVGGTQTNPGQAESLSQSNATLAAAPNPQAATQEQAQTYLAGLQLARGGFGAGYSTAPTYAGFPDASTSTGTNQYAADVASNLGAPGTDPYMEYNLGGGTTDYMGNESMFGGGGDGS
jgi:hypothetical protein